MLNRNWLLLASVYFCNWATCMIVRQFSQNMHDVAFYTWIIMMRQTPEPSSDGSPYIPVITYTTDWPTVIIIPNTKMQWNGHEINNAYMYRLKTRMSTALKDIYSEYKCKTFTNLFSSKNEWTCFPYRQIKMSHLLNFRCLILCNWLQF